MSIPILGPDNRMASLKTASDGSLRVTATTGATGSEVAQALRVDAEGRLIIGGATGGPFGSGSGSYPAASISNGFDAQVAGMTLVHDVRFGTAATGGTQQIRNLAELSAFAQWDPVGNADLTQTRMAYFDNFFEFSKFDGPYAGNVFNFGSNSLTLRPHTLHSWNSTIVTECSAANVPTSGVSVLASTLGLASTSGLWIGRVVASMYGQYAARVTAFNGTNVTLTLLNGATGAPVGWSGGTHLMFWTAMTALPVPAGVSAGDTTFSLGAAPPAAVQNGMICCGVDAYNYVKREKYGSLATVSGSTITLTAPGMQRGIAAGGCVLFLPRVITGQIVPNWLFSEPGIGCARAIEIDMTVADNGAGQAKRVKYINTLSAFNAAGGTAIPTATWISFWLYMQQRALAGQVDFVISDNSNAEIDALEQQGHFTSGPADWSCAYHNYLQMRDHANGEQVVFIPAAEGVPTYVKWDGTDEAYFTRHPSGALNGVCQIPLSGSVSSTIKRQLTWERDRASIFSDGVLRTRFAGQWSSRRPGQLILNAALGVLGDLSNIHFPLSDAGLANCRLIVRSIKVWELQ